MRVCEQRYQARYSCCRLRLLLTLQIIPMICVALPTAYADFYRNMTKLHSDLMMNYNRDVRPIENQSNGIHASVIYTLTSLNDFDAVKGRLVTAGSLFIVWTDEMMIWNPNDYSGIEKVRMRKTNVWAPTFVVANGADSIHIKGTKYEDLTILYEHTGMASFLLSSVLTTTCDPDITYYPYDVHRCGLQFTTQEPIDEVSLNMPIVYLLPGVDNNLLWKLGTAEIRTYNVENTHSFIEVTIKIERRPTYIMYSFLFPVCLLNFLNLLAFVLPADSGERISFATTILLTLSVYMTIMSDSIPNTSDPVPILTISLMIKLLTSSLIVLMAVLNSIVYQRNEVTSIPSWLICVACIRNKNRTKILRTGHKLADNRHEHPETQEVMGGVTSQEYGSRRSITWQEVGRSLDLNMLCLFSLITLTETIVNMVRIMCQIG